MLASSKLLTIIWTSNLADSEKFYSGILGLPCKGRVHGALIYDVGGSELRVSPVPSTRPSEHTVAGFAVSNIAAIASHLQEKGIVWERFAGFPHDSQGAVTLPDGTKILWFRDPDGNLLSIVELASSTAAGG